MAKMTRILLVLAWVAGGSAIRANEADSLTGSLICEPWTAVDGLGRRVADPDSCDEPHRDRYVGIFYFLWLGEHPQRGPHNITKILEQPSDDRQWGEENVFHWWDEPRFGYYLSDDEWVIAKHAQLLADAGVDVVFFDVTNAYTYRMEYLTLCKVYRRLRSQGWKTPQVSFLFNSKARETTLQVYRDFYQKNLYPELWFRWKGKPLILTIPADLPSDMLDFFSIRRSWAWSSQDWFGNGRDKWPWLDHTPQAYGWHEDPAVPEFMPVASAEHPISGIGRSHSAGRQPLPEEQDAGAGIYFQEQWDHALKIDPEFVFITGWNEWVAQRFIANRHRRVGDEYVDKGGTVFVDQYNREYSRDIEPMRGGFQDNYYYQMVSNIRRFKGVLPQPESAGYRRIIIDGRGDDWVDVHPTYHDDRGDTMDRRHPGFADAGPYTNQWGRNDIVSCQVARGEGHAYFLVRTAAPLTLPDTGDPGWMNLLLRIHGRRSKDQGEFHYRIMPTAAGDRLAAVSAYRDERWIKVLEIPCVIGENLVELAFPLSDGPAAPQPLELEFKWFDHVPEPLTTIDFMDHGDTAPNNRFRYLYRHRGGRAE